MAVYNVTNAQQLQSALGLAIGGDRIVLAPGDYGSVSITGRNYASMVTIQTSTPSNPAHLDGLFVSRSSNLTFTGLDLGRGLADGESWKTSHLNTVKDSSNIRFAGVNIHGSLDNNPANDGSGLTVTRVDGFRIDMSSFSELFRGLNIQQSSRVTVLNNSFETMRSDGITVAAAQNILIDRNSFTDFRPITGDHADAIQFWNTGQTVGSSSVTIRNNVIAPGSADYAVQGIFMSDPLSFGYKSVQINNNLIYMHGAWHGINVDGANGISVTGNTVVSHSTDEKSAWIRLGDTTKATLSGNITDDVLLTNVTGLTQSNNIDFSLNPAQRALIPALDQPAQLTDLIVSGVGFQIPAGSSAAVTTLTEQASAFLGTAPLRSALEAQFDAFVALP